MPLFTLTDPTEVTLSTFTARVEKHGKDNVSALTLGLTMTGPNTLLDLVTMNDSLRHALYRRNDDAQEALPDVEPPTPKLRTKMLVSPLALSIPEIVGGTLFVEWGTGEDMAFSKCTVNKWRVECFDGGTVTLSFKVSTSDVSEEEAGHLFGKQGQVLMVRFEPPQPIVGTSEGGTIDGTRGPGPLFDPDDDGEGDTQDATDIFASSVDE